MSFWIKDKRVEGKEPEILNVRVGNSQVVEKRGMYWNIHSR